MLFKIKCLTACFRLSVTRFLQEGKSRFPISVFIVYHNLKGIQKHKWRYAIFYKIMFEHDTDF